MNNCNGSTYCVLLVPSLAVFAFIFGYEFLFHAKIMMPLYVETAALWRKQEAMQALFPYSLLIQFTVAFVITWLFSRNFESKGIMEGVRFGMLVGLLLGIRDAGAYSYIAITPQLAVMWLLGTVVEGIGAGIVLAFVFGKCRKTREACMKQ